MQKTIHEQGTQTYRTIFLLVEAYWLSLSRFPLLILLPWVPQDGSVIAWIPRALSISLVTWSVPISVIAQIVKFQ